MDISVLVALNDQIRVSDLRVLPGVEFITEADEVVALAQAPAEEEVDAPVLDMDAIEVEQKGKGETEAEPEA